MWKTNKSDLAKKLESVCAEVPKGLNQPYYTGYVSNGMAMLQSVSESYLRHLIIRRNKF